MAATKFESYKKCMHTININMVQGRSYENFQNEN